MEHFFRLNPTTRASLRQRRARDGSDCFWILLQDTRSSTKPDRVEVIHVSTEAGWPSDDQEERMTQMLQACQPVALEYTDVVAACLAYRWLFAGNGESICERAW
jgi:hypothetical protein